MAIDSGQTTPADRTESGRTESGRTESGRTESDLTESDATIAGLDALDLAGGAGVAKFGRRLWSAAWPKMAAVSLVVGLWQVVVWSGWKDPWVLPGPAQVGQQLWQFAGQLDFWHAIATTMRRALVGFLVAAVIGLALGIVVARNRLLRAAIGSTITGLQTMPSIAWYPLAILLFQLNESAIYFVVVLGAAPSIANGVIAGVDYVAPMLLRAGRNIGATGWKLYVFVIAPASLPAIVAGLKQGWAFAWRSLMAGELLVLMPDMPALGARMEILRQLNDATGVVAMMIAIFIVGVAADLVFSRVDVAVRRRWGVMDNG